MFCLFEISIFYYLFTAFLCVAVRGDVFFKETKTDK